MAWVLGLLFFACLVPASNPVFASGPRLVLEPGLQAGGPLASRRFKSSHLRIVADAGLEWPAGAADGPHSVGVTVQGSFAGTEARFALRPRYLWRGEGRLPLLLSAGYIFYTAESADGVEYATVSNSGFAGGAAVALGDLTVGLDLSVVSVGPTTGHAGGTESSLFGTVALRGKSGAKLGVWGFLLVTALGLVFLAAGS